VWEFAYGKISKIFKDYGGLFRWSGTAAQAWLDLDVASREAFSLLDE
jgi:hypothetical protein